MARKKSQAAFPTGILLLALAASIALLAYLLWPVGPDTAGDSPRGAGNEGNPLEYEFYGELLRNEVQVNSAAGEPLAPEPADESPAPRPAEVENMVDQLTASSRTGLEVAAEALEQIAETIVTGLETPVPEPVAAPDPAPPDLITPRPRADIVRAAPTATEARRETGTVLQSGAFRQQERALSELERQQGLGLEVEMRQRPGQNGPLFLLQSGPYDSRDRLEEAEMVFRLNNIDTARLSPP